jgi:hypothetical protein
MNLDESKLLPTLRNINRYSARDVADLAFCYMLALHMCRQEFETAPWVRLYATTSLSVNGWHTTNLNRTDLYQFLTVLISQTPTWTHNLRNPDASDLLLKQIRVNPHSVERFLHNLQQVSFDPELSGRLLLQMERDLKITTSNYKSMRRILTDWHMDHVDTEAQCLVMTRLLQALRAKALRGDVIARLQSLARDRDWEIHHACDPETGKNCGITANTTTPKKPSLLKQLAVGAGLGVGAYLLGKALFGGSKK